MIALATQVAGLLVLGLLVVLGVGWLVPDGVLGDVLVLIFGVESAVTVGLAASGVPGALTAWLCLTLLLAGCCSFCQFSGVGEAEDAPWHHGLHVLIWIGSGMWIIAMMIDPTGELIPPPLR